MLKLWRNQKAGNVDASLTAEDAVILTCLGFVLALDAVKLVLRKRFQSIVKFFSRTPTRTTSESTAANSAGYINSLGCPNLTVYVGCTGTMITPRESRVDCCAPNVTEH
jgi:hypothetical protein